MRSHKASRRITRTSPGDKEAMTNPLSNDELISAYLDGELSSEERARAERLVAEDADSRQLLEELRSLRDSISALPRHQLDANFAETIMDRAERAMIGGETVDENGEDEERDSESDDGDANLESPSLPTTTLPPKQPMTRDRLVRLLAYPAIAVAAAVMIMFVFPEGEENLVMSDAEAPAATGDEDAPALGYIGEEMPPVTEGESVARPSLGPRQSLMGKAETAQAGKDREFQSVEARQDVAYDDVPAAPSKAPAKKKQSYGKAGGPGIANTADANAVQAADAAANELPAAGLPVPLDVELRAPIPLADREEESPYAGKQAGSRAESNENAETDRGREAARIAARLWEAKQPRDQLETGANSRSRVARRGLRQKIDAVAVVDSQSVKGKLRERRDSEAALAPLWSRHQLLAKALPAAVAGVDDADGESNRQAAMRRSKQNESLDRVFLVEGTEEQVRAALAELTTANRGQSNRQQIQAYAWSEVTVPKASQVAGGQADRDSADDAVETNLPSDKKDRSQAGQVKADLPSKTRPEPTPPNEESPAVDDLREAEKDEAAGDGQHESADVAAENDEAESLFADEVGEKAGEDKNSPADPMPVDDTSADKETESPEDFEYKPLPRRGGSQRRIRVMVVIRGGLPVVDVPAPSETNGAETDDAETDADDAAEE